MTKPKRAAKSKRAVEAWDSCIWIGYLGDGDCSTRILDLVDTADERPIVLVVPAVVLAKVDAARGTRFPRAEAWFHDQLRKPYVRIAPVMRREAFEAVTLQRCSAFLSKKLKPMDALVLACSIRANVERLYTCDERLLAFGAMNEASGKPYFNGPTIVHPSDAADAGPLFDQPAP